MLVTIFEGRLLAEVYDFATVGSEQLNYFRAAVL